MDSRKSGFTLVELLVVIAIVAILTVIAAPALSSLSDAGDTNNAVSGIALVLNQARAYAMAQNTYVWVGFAPNATAQQLTVGVVAGTTGDVGDLTSSTTCIPLAKLQTYNHLSLKNLSGITGMSTSGDDIATSQVGSFQQSGGGTTVTFTSVLQFSPQGEASIDKTPGASHWIQIGLQPLRGGNSTGANAAVVQVGALTGQVQVYRP
jgi:prepilin-type N-terminal cleavage/methylation domain-containing protein